MKKILLFVLSASLVLFACAPAEEAEDAAPGTDVAVEESLEDVRQMVKAAKTPAKQS